MKALTKISIYLILIFVAIAMIFPMAWMIILSLKEYPESLGGFFNIIFSDYTIKNYSEALVSDSFDIYFSNSLIVAFFVTLGNIIFCLMAGYALARRNTKFNTLIWLSILGVIIIPHHVVMIPLYRLIVEFGWINTYYALIVPWLVTPFGIFLIRQYIITLPRDIEDAARIDGAGEWYILFRVVAPLCKPILTVLAIYTFLGNWNSFLMPFLLTNEIDYRTLPVGLTFYLGKQSIDWGHLMAGAGMSALPIIILFIFFQKKIINGLTAGALKE